MGSVPPKEPLPEGPDEETGMSLLLIEIGAGEGGSASGEVPSSD